MPTNPQNHSTRVVIADDEGLVAALTRSQLHSLGYTVIGIAPDGQKAVDLVCELRPAVVVMDVEMPLLDGIASAAAIQRRCPTPVVILSAHPQPENVEKAARAGVGAFVTKPPQCDELGRAITIAMARHADLMELNRVNGELQQSERRLHRALEAGEFGAWEYDFSTQRAVRSARHRQIFGHPASDPDWTVSKFFAHVLEEDRPEVIRHSDLSKPEAISPEFECRIRRTDGAIRWIGVWREVEFANDGRPLFLRGMVRDITRRKEEEANRSRHEQARQKAMQLESMVGITNGVAHDFNNSLGAILATTDLVATVDRRSAVFAEGIEIIRSSVRKATRLTDMMLAYSGSGFALPEKVMLTSLIEECRGDLLALADGRVELRWDLESGQPTIRADRAQIRLLIVNIVANAIEACLPRGGVVSVLTRVRREFTPSNLEAAGLSAPSPADYICFQVRDTGTGIVSDDRARMFDPFYSTKFVGRGMGLAAVAGITRRLHGAIEVESEVERGTTFSVYLPTEVPAVAERRVPAASAPEAAEASQRTILVVDDDDDMRVTTALALELQGYAVVKAEDGETALAVFNTNPARFETVLLDLTMPKVDGDRVFEEMLRVRPDVRVIIMSGYAEDQVTARLRGKRPLAFLRKPFSSEQLFSAIARSGAG